MAESGLSGGWPELKAEVGFFLNYGRGVNTAWTSDQESEIEDVVHSGVRRVYYPPATREQDIGYEWSWLKPTTTLSIQGVYNTGTLTIAAGVVTLSAAGTFPSWAASGEITVSGGVYSVNTRDGDNQVTLDDTSVTVAALAAYGLNQVAYDLPDDLGRISGALHYEADEHRAEIRIVPVGHILQLRASQILSNNPWYAATRFKSADVAATGSRQEILFYPSPDEAHVLSYEYEAYSGKLTDSLPYPLGGMQMYETYLESCLAVAEVRLNDEPGVHVSEFGRLIVDAVARDRKRGPKHLGPMGHREGRGHGGHGRGPYGTDDCFHRGWGAGPYQITFS